MKNNLEIESIREEILTEKKNEIEDLLHRWGGPISEAILDPRSDFFQVPEIEGFIGYRLTSSCAVIYGDPVCASEDKYRLAEAFQKYCHEKKLNPIYISASEQFAKSAINRLCKILIEIGEGISFDPFIDPKEGTKRYRLRNRINHALHLGLAVHEYVSKDKSIEEAIQNVGVAWLKARQGPQIYLGELNFFENRNGKRWFYVTDQEQKIIAVALLSRLDAYEGWLLKFLIIMPETPRGTSELLMTSILEILKKEECHFLTYGMVPAENLGEIIGLKKISSWVVKIIFKTAKWIFHLDQRKLYWQKFHPKIEPCYLLFSQPKIGIKEIRALMNSLKIS